jgi:hypothetical protein
MLNLGKISKLGEWKDLKFEKTGNIIFAVLTRDGVPQRLRPEKLVAYFSKYWL